MSKRAKLIARDDGSYTLGWYVRAMENGKKISRWTERTLPSRNDAIKEARELGIVQVIAESGGLKNLSSANAEKGA